MQNSSLIVQAEPSVFESEPARLDDVVREEDTDWNAGMPRVDTTKKMLAKFRNLQAEAAAKDSPARPQPQARKVSSLASTPSPPLSRFLSVLES